MSELEERKRLFVYFKAQHFYHIAPLFTDVFPLRQGDVYIGKDESKRRVDFTLIESVSRDQIHCIETGRHDGYIESYVVVPLDFLINEWEDSQD